MSRSVITFHYVLKDPSGALIDSSQGGEPITYLEGAGQIIEGLEEQMKGVTSGTKTVIRVPASKAYGEPDPQLIQKVKRNLLPVEEIKIGDRFQTGADRHDPVVTVQAVDGDEVTLDANHPLAGVDLEFSVDVVSVRSATEDELEHGHVHGPGGAHH